MGTTHKGFFSEKKSRYVCSTFHMRSLSVCWIFLHFLPFLSAVQRSCYKKVRWREREKNVPSKVLIFHLLRKPRKFRTPPFSGLTTVSFFHSPFFVLLAPFEVREPFMLEGGKWFFPLSLSAIICRNFDKCGISGIELTSLFSLHHKLFYLVLFRPLFLRFISPPTFFPP